MKKLLFIFSLILFTLIAKAQQTETIRNKTKSTATTTQKTLKLQQPGDNSSLIPKLPDLKFSSFNVTAIPSSSSGGITTYTLNISFSVKNDGSAGIRTDDVTLAGFLSDETWVTLGKKNLSLTGFLTAAGGMILSSIPNRGETLLPGATKQITYSLYNKQLGTDPKPIFIIVINTGVNIKESDSGNNMAYMTILI